ncbi:hypothetical protein N7495_006294 [Penicillium taxi]|uniref:uncharacterized protein n=1 Tax=Penicillium taxi TaxID=168475 RepID=UPI002545BAC1|nr:uncharacterized protein N7495_006294 [Penicillium taxi]KAJ5894603.1 hypothetical protein N7495_006294 [Penicillium taxi]
MPLNEAAQLVMSALNSPSDNRTLRFTENGTFHISIFEDLHFAEDDDKDAKTQKLMTQILSQEETQPQLVVLNGDLISGEATKADNADQYLDEVVAPLVSAGKLWASTYGNHDSNPNLDPLKDIYEKEQSYSNSLTKRMVSGSKAGITNYYLPVYPQKTSESIPALILWFFDSKGGNYAKNRGDNRSGARGDWAIDWFHEAKANLTTEYGRVIPSIAFYHIPVHAMFAFQKKGVDLNKTPGINGETVVSQGSGDTNYTGQDSRFMRALLDTKGLMATFSGHDHQDDWCFKWDGHNMTGDGIHMCYGRRTGYGGYGDAVRGARQILLNQENFKHELQTWVRLEDGNISAPITLNSTYGKDQYGKVFQKEVKTSAGPSIYDQSALLLLVYLCISAFSISYFRH